MKSKVASVVLGAALMAPGAAQADETGLKISNGVGIGGLATGVVLGPALSIAGIFVAVDSAANTVEGNGNGRGILGGAAISVVGLGLTAVSPAIVVGSSIAGNMSVDGAPLTPAIIGLVGIGIQAAGWFATINAINNLNPAGVGTLLRFTGWTTGMVGGGVQLAANNKAFRDNGRSPVGGKMFRVVLVPTHNGAGVVGRF